MKKNKYLITVLFLFTVTLGGCSFMNNNNNIVNLKDVITKNGKINVEKAKSNGYRTEKEMYEEGKFGLTDKMVSTSHNHRVAKKAIKQKKDIENYIKKSYEPVLGQKIKIVMMTAAYPYESVVVHFKTVTGPEMNFEKTVGLSDNWDSVDTSPDTFIPTEMSQGFISGIYYYAYQNEFEKIKKEVLKNNRYKLSMGYIPVETLGRFVSIGDASDDDIDFVNELIHDFKEHPNEPREYWRKKIEETDKLSLFVNISFYLRDEKDVATLDEARDLYQKYGQQLLLPKVVSREVALTNSLLSYDKMFLNNSKYSEKLNDKGEWVHDNQEDINQVTVEKLKKGKLSQWD